MNNEKEVPVEGRIEIAARAGGIFARGVCGLSARHARWSILGFGMVGALIAGGCATHHAASMQTLKSDSLGINWAARRLSVRPRTMASGTRTVQEGLQELGLDSLHGGDALSGTLVYVPPQCVGTRRVPLVVFLHGSAMDGASMMAYHDDILPQLAKEYGFIIVTPSAHTGTWTLALNDPPPIPDVRRIDDVLRYVLQHYAIDPTRIALAGESNGGSMTLAVGLMNGDLFSRLMALSPSLSTVRYYSELPGNGRPPIFIGHNEDEAKTGELAYDASKVVPLLRHKGYGVTYIIDSSGHGASRERSKVGFRWLAQSW
jgi:phospholipase/carboxylesterase